MFYSRKLTVCWRNANMHIVLPLTVYDRKFLLLFPLGLAWAGRRFSHFYSHKGANFGVIAGGSNPSPSGRGTEAIMMSHQDHQDWVVDWLINFVIESEIWVSWVVLTFNLGLINIINRERDRGWERERKREKKNTKFTSFLIPCTHSFTPLISLTSHVCTQ